MPTNYTSNYRLNQWERSDKVLMDDFNADNAKIDAALAFHPSAELICSVTVEEEERELVLDVSQLDWSRYMALVLMADSAEYNGFIVNMGSNSRYTCSISRAQNTFSYSALAELSYAAHITLLIPVFYDGTHAASAFSLGTGYYDSDGRTITVLGGGGANTPLNQCTRITVQSKNNTFSPGDRVVLWGVK